MQLNRDGMSVSPSVGLAYTPLIVFSNNITENEADELCYKSESVFKTDSEMQEYLKSIHRDKKEIEVDKITYAENYKGNTKMGRVTGLSFNGKLELMELTMYPHRTLKGFQITFNHELIHVYHQHKYDSYTLEKDGDYTETVAYRYTGLYYENIKLPKDIPPYTGNLSLFDIPWDKLIPIYLER